jgi:hypothetical protein
MSAGIDYGMGRTNINHETGIRYGVISQHSVSQAWCDSAEPDYGEPTCPKCGNAALEYDSDQEGEDWEAARHECADFMCVDCEYVFGSESAYSEEPQSWSYSDEGYELGDCLDSDIIVVKSPFYTFAPFCSPCVPGAGNLDSAEPDGVKTYCLGHDWFEDGAAPYPVYSVETEELVEPSKS